MLKPGQKVRVRAKERPLITKWQFQKRVQKLLDQTLQEGPGPRAVASIIAALLIDYICNEAGAVAPEAVEEVIHQMRRQMRDMIETE